MLSLMMEHMVTLAACVAIGAATGWWTFRDARPRKGDKR